MNHPDRWTRDEERLRSVLDELAAMEGRSGETLAGYPGRDRRAIIVETTTTDGMHTVARITAAPASAAPVSAQLTEEEAAAVRSLVLALLDLLGRECGSARTEIVLTPSGPSIVDCWLEELPRGRE